LLKTKNLRLSVFRTIREIRSKTQVETRIEHATAPSADRAKLPRSPASSFEKVVIVNGVDLWHSNRLTLMPTADRSSGRSPSSTASVTELLSAWSRGDAAALARVIPLVYDELRRVARAHLRREAAAGRLLQTTALVHEAYLKLARLQRVTVLDRPHFVAVTARLMRQILVDEARRKRSGKRGAGATVTSLEGVSSSRREHLVDVVAVDEALTRLAAADPQQARIVELRFFGGLTADETADALGISVATVHRDWTMAKAWLHRQLGL